MRSIFISFMQIIQKQILSFILLCFIFCLSTYNSNAQRTKENINKDWYYLEDNSSAIPEVRYKGNWIKINIPHSWNSLDATDLEPGYRRSASWYKKTINFAAISKNQSYLLYFEGANITTKVFVNGMEAGSHIGGYLGFNIEISSYIKTGDNEILVRVDNSYNPEIIPSQQADFFIFGGITRDVWLLTIPKNHIEHLKINTPNVSVKQAALNVDVQINEFTKNNKISLKAVLIDPNGKTIAVKNTSIKGKVTNIKFNDINNPELWDVDDPNLYTLRVTLLENNIEKDKIEEKTGFRWFEFKDYGPFYLNGRRLKLRGTHRHEEHAGVGAAMTNEQHRKDMESIKEMGANFVRLAHYPQDPEIYKACDELGLLVWDELPWCRGGVGDREWQTNTKNMLREMINQNYNHPSIIIWSLGNEMNWLPDFVDGDNTEKMNTFLSELNDISHSMDPSRKTAVRKYYEGSDIVDVFSPSIWSGWYSGSYKSYQKAIDTYKKEYKHFIHAEYGGSSHIGRHSENPVTGEGIIQSDGWEEEIVQTKVANIAQIGDWSENYIVDLFDWHLRISETDTTFVGNVQWAFKDFGTPLRPENDIPYMNQKGLMDRSGKPKDAYYVFKSYWSKKPFTYIESKTWTERQGPENTPRTISVYSNCEKVAFYHDGNLLGEKIRNINKFPASGLTWDVNFKQGQNVLIAKGFYSTGEVVCDTLEVNYPFEKNGAAKALKLSFKKLENDNYLITATAVDQNGLQCLDYEERVYFQCLEGGEMLGNRGTPTGSAAIAMANGKASIEIAPLSTSKSMTVMVLNQSFKGTYLKIKTY
ncbi:MAG: glycoside hydrolase family 2 TIM barrel-domain containing protein [Bacteroidales bacterium]|nr:glycoside hydrolase family 2 TIM barrel-domain containing protein [Bacteroidales bacterium]